VSNRLCRPSSPCLQPWLRASFLAMATYQSSESAPNFFVLVTADAVHASGSRIDAAVIAEHRLRLSKWPIYKNTRNRKLMRRGDIVFVYVGGTRRLGGRIIARAVIGDIGSPKAAAARFDVADALTAPAELVLSLRQITPMRDVDFRSLIWKLSIAPKQRRGWGTALMGGSRRLSEQDAEMLIRASESSSL
jgi:hypothetical protein